MSEDKKVAPAQFTEIQNTLMELHDKLFPESKYVSPEDLQFLKAAIVKTKGEKEQHEVEECSKEKAKLSAVVEAAFELRHCKFGREYKKACQKFDKLYSELEKK